MADAATPAPATDGLPDLGAAVAPLLGSLPREQQPLLVALAERVAATRYRGWAAEPELAARRAELEACAAREEEIAASVEALYADAASQQDAIRAAHPDLQAIYTSLFVGRSLREQLVIQSRGERPGAATWRAFARDADDTRREVFEACALLEEQSAALLEEIAAGGREAGKPVPGGR